MKSSILLAFCAALLTSTAAPALQGSTGFRTLIEFDDAKFQALYTLDLPADGTKFAISKSFHSG